MRKAIAREARVGARNVSNVETILQLAHPKLIIALQQGRLTIHRAVQFCKLPKARQFEQFMHYSEERKMNMVIRQAIRRPKKGLGGKEPNILITLELSRLSQRLIPVTIPQVSLSETSLGC